MKLLIVEDETDLAELMRELFEDIDYKVTVCNDGIEGEYYACEYPFDAIVLDIMLPGNDGWEILKSIRKQGIMTPVLMLTALGEVEDKVKGLNRGADDYLPKPCDPRELVARVKSAIRRASMNSQKTDKIFIEDLLLDMTKQRVEKGGRQIPFTPKEYSIFEYLCIHKGEIVSKEALQEHLWDEDDSFWSDVLRTHIKNIRKKIGDKKGTFLKTIRGKGYVMG
ncbi:MAG: response regulator transcription factor [Thermotogota bacterium]|nr:response regulator transcription factor [Thermotogota bacterium]